MIVKILSAGKSFKGLGAYLTHDPGAQTAERVGWTHTLNLAHDHVPSAVDEMLWTARQAEWLKQEAGVRAGGRSTENPVKHTSLNWAPDERPERDHMIAASEDFLRHMGWAENQSLIVCHTDRAHAHVHLMLNTVHPETGLQLDDGFERRRAQAWALDYEKSQGRIYCEQRLLDPAEREDAPTRPAWRAFAQRDRDFREAENARENAPAPAAGEPENPAAARAAEWKLLKQLQKEERQAFMNSGRAAFSELRTAVYREVRTEFRDRWAEFYEARENGDADPAALAETKAALVEEQARVLAERRDAACIGLREARDERYQDLLGAQRDGRLDLRLRQEAGLDNSVFLAELQERITPRDPAQAFRTTGPWLTEPGKEKAPPIPGPFDFAPREDKAGMRSGGAIALDVGFGLFSFLAGFVGGSSGTEAQPPPPPRAPEHDPQPDWDRAAAEQERQRQQRALDDEEDAKRRRERENARE